MDEGPLVPERPPKVKEEERSYAERVASQVSSLVYHIRDENILIILPAEFCYAFSTWHALSSQTYRASTSQLRLPVQPQPQKEESVSSKPRPG
jgi:hypothetical protein